MKQLRKNDVAGALARKNRLKAEAAVLADEMAVLDREMHQRLDRLTMVRIEMNCIDRYLKKFEYNGRVD